MFVKKNNLFEPDHESKNDQRNEVLSGENLDTVRSAFVKTVIRPWEEMTHNKHRTSLGDNNDVSIHIPDFAKPIKFQSAGFLDGVVPEKVNRCQQCNRVGHVKDWCFDLHLCEHCGK